MILASVDPITFGVISSRLSGIVQEMQDSIFRTGYSTIVRESQDASCMILDADGDVVGEHVIAPLHITALPIVVRRIRELFDGDLGPGDIFITNHPYAADVTHSIDMAVTGPLFAGDRLVAFCASIAHKSDLGGAIPGTANGSARELFQEGILYPPVRYMKRGALVRDVDAILRANSRTPELVLGDIRGQIGVSRLGERRLLETIERYGLETVLAVFAEKQDKTELRVRRALAAWPDGISEAETLMEGDGEEVIRYHVRVEKSGDRIVFDFTGSSDQTTMPINVRPSIVRGCCYYAMIGMIDPDIENNGGLARVVETRLRSGSVLDPHFPAPTNAYMTTAAAVTEAIVAALSRLARDRRVAGVGGVGAFALAGTRPDGAAFQTYELLGSAYGARSGLDGISGVAVLLSNARTAPIEIMETEFPLRFRSFGLIADSGGAGRYRGGLGFAREYELLAPQAQMTLRGGKHAIPAYGIDGGCAGRLGSLVT
ncbi:MAG TPA: hydantoinase B/oxoprolinase family protein, partial [Candidatus Binatia bacterium]|nr:hydantoinase B/oxoprolinase family protein [Candidatus Binatia bacterium]